MQPILTECALLNDHDIVHDMDVVNFVEDM